MVLYIEFQAVISAHHDHTLSERERPEKYSSGESAWGVKGGVQSAWGDSKGKKSLESKNGEPMNYRDSPRCDT